jgi:hypothetical protein
VPAVRDGIGLPFLLFRNPNYTLGGRTLSKDSFDPRPFIERAGWTFAKTVAEKAGWRHWYIVESVEQDADFRRFAELIESQGYRARFEGIAYRYLRIDDFLFWTSRSLWGPGQNINRRPAADVEGQPEHEQAQLPGVSVDA